MLKKDKQQQEVDLGRMKERVTQLEREGEVLRQVAADRSAVEEQSDVNTARITELEQRLVGMTLTLPLVNN